MTWHRVVRFAGLLLVCVWMVGCDGAKKKGPEKVKVKGTVTLDGSPMKEGEVIFALAEPGSEGHTMQINNNGEFAGEVAVGNNRVSVYLYRPGPPSTTDPNTPTKVNTIPDRYSTSTTLTATVSKEGPNEFKFDVKSR